MKHSVQNFSTSLKRIMITCNAKKSIAVSVMRTVYNYMLGNWVVQLCLGLSWCGRGQVGHFMAKRDVETWGGAPQSCFYGRGGVRLEIDRCRVIGGGIPSQTTRLPMPSADV